MSLVSEVYSIASLNERKPKERRRPRSFHSDLSMNRWKVERFFSWLINFRRLATPFERFCMMCLGFTQQGCAMLLLRNVLK